MNVLIKIVVFLFGTLIWHSAMAQNPNHQLNLVSAKLNKANNYSVDIHVKVDLPFIKMLPINARIYYKQKDKFKVVSKSIAIVPKQGFVQLSKLINDTNSFTALYQNGENIGGIKTALINIIPLNDTGDVVLGKLWIDETEHLILKSQITSKLNGTILTTYKYTTEKKFGLPSEMVFEVDVKKFKIPKAVAADINTTTTPVTTNNKGKKGTIVITLSNYLINKGIDDAVFKK